MAHARPSRSLLLWLIIGGVLLGSADASTQGRADTPFPAYRHAQLEGRFQVETPLPRKPSPALEAAALGRARAAARARDEAALAEAARDIVIHAEVAATGWSKAAAVWAGLRMRPPQSQRGSFNASTCLPVKHPVLSYPPSSSLL